MSIAAFAIQLVLAAPDLIKAGLDMYEIFSRAKKTIESAQAEGRDITAAEWDEQEASINALRAELSRSTADLKS